MTQRNAKTREATPPKEVIGDTTTVRGKLALLGWPSLSAWGEAHGYERRTVAMNVKKWGNRIDRRPHGGISRQLMSDLRETLANGKRPEQTPATQGE